MPGWMKQPHCSAAVWLLLLGKIGFLFCGLAPPDRRAGALPLPGQAAPFCFLHVLPRTNSLIWPLTTSSFSCTIFSDMVCSLLSEWCVATSFYQSSANHASFFLLSICATYLTLSLTMEQLVSIMAVNPKRMVNAIFFNFNIN